VIATPSRGRLARFAPRAASLFVSAAIALAGAETAAAGPASECDARADAHGVRLAQPGEPEWKPEIFPNIDRHTRYERVLITIPGGSSQSTPAYHARADCSASGLLLPLPDIDLERTPVLSWSWKIVRAPGGPDERSAAGDDFAARVYVLFRFDKEAASAPAWVAHGLLSRLLRRPAPGVTLNYVWTRRIAEGETWRNPSVASTRMLAIRSEADASARGPGEEAGWVRERVDVRADYLRLMGGSEPKGVLALAIMTDSDAVCDTAEALFADFRFECSP